MKSFVVFALIALAVVSAEAPRGRGFPQQQQQTAQAYRPRGFRPSPAFQLPLRALPQQTYGPPPQPSYGPPAQEPTTAPAPTTTESFTEEATTEPQSENFAVESQNRAPKTDKSGKQEQQEQRRPVFFVLSQKVQAQPQKLLYTIQQNAALVAAPQPKALVYSTAPLVALPAAEVQTAKLQLLPASAATTTSIVTPYSSSFVQVFQ